MKAIYKDFPRETEAEELLPIDNLRGNAKGSSS